MTATLEKNSMRRWLIAIMVALASSSAAASEIRVMAAGSLRDVFAAVFADYEKLYGDGFAPVWGPSGVLRERLQKGEAFDIFASAGLPHAQVLTEAGVSGPSVLFVRNALCIVTDADRQLDAGNLVETLLKPEIRIGTSTPVSDPAGDYTWEMFHKNRCPAARRLRDLVQEGTTIGRQCRHRIPCERPIANAGRTRRPPD
jgi:ABC-type molybdate transport system substrate-binding protein